MQTNTLKIPVERLREGPLALEVNAQPQFLDLVDEAGEFTFEGPVTGQVVFQIVGQDVLGSGELTAQVQSACVRCLEPTRTEIKIPVNETWMRNKPEEDVDREFMEDEPLTRSYNGDEIDLTEPFRELIMSELPDRPLCSEDCKGLCPHCGTNLNQEPCHCSPAEKEASEEARIPEWKQALKHIKLDNKG